MNRNYIMTGWQKSRIINITFAVLLIFLLSCKEEAPPKIVVAKVGNSVLTEDELDSLLTFAENKNKYREEVIRNWVDSEILFLEAEDEGITKSADYLNLIETNKKKIAASLYLQSYFSEKNNEVNETELINYYNKHITDFKVPVQAYVYNHAVFKDENKAILFRNTLIESDWNKAVNVFSGDETIILSTSNNFKYVHEINSDKVKIVLNNLELSETSIIFEIIPGRFNIVQLIAKYEKGDIPDFNFVKDIVKRHYLSTKKTKSYEELLQNLYSKYDVIINR